MKKILLFFLALCATLPLWASNTITYTATAQLPEVTGWFSSGLHTNAFYNGDTQLTITDHTFDDATHTGTITFSGEVTKIGSKAFSGCSGLTSVTIPTSVTSIGEMAFNGTGLTSITIPNSVTSIGGSAFESCKGLTSVTIPASVTTIGYNAFSSCSGLTSITIPASVTLIGYMAFAYCSDLTSITIPGSVTSIGDMAFAYCSDLTSITIPGSVTSIGYGAFAGTALTSITLPASITSIGSSTFSRCSGLTSITIPASVTSIDDEAFSECASLTSITIPASVTSIGYMAFNECSNLASIQLLCTTPPTIGLDIFNECSSLSHIYVPSGSVSAYKNASGWADFSSSIEAAVTTITYTATAKLPEVTGSFNAGIHTDAFYEGDTQLSITAHTFDDATHIGTITLNGYVTKFGSFAFCGSSALTSVTIPASVTEIGTGVFEACTALASVTIPNSVTTIGKNAFFCTGLTSITIPNSVTSIGDKAFTSCYSLTSITIGSSVTSIGDNIFDQCSALASITIAAGNTKYDSREGCNAIIETATNCLIIGCKTSTIPASVTSIGYKAFYTIALTSVTIPGSVTSIGNSAFSRCSNLTSVTIGSSVTSIGEFAFSDCSNLTSVTIGSSVTSIGEMAFNGTGLTSVTIPAAVTSIGSYAFYDCSDLATINILCTTPPELTDFFFSNSDSPAIYIPCSAVDAYNADYAWNYLIAAGYITAACAGPETLSDDTNPASTLTSLSGQTKDIVINRILWRDGYYNTLCLPFSLSAAELAAGPLAGFSALKTFTSATVNGEYLDIVLADATAIEAGRPYLISWPAAATNIIDPQFDGVLISATSASTDGAGSVQFVGSFAPVSLAAGDSHQLFVGANNVLYWSDGTGNLPGFRAYFNISAGDGAPIRLGMSARFVESGTDATTALPSALSPLQPAEKILRNGQVLILRDGQTFDLLGRPVF